jgi:ATP phosphoribosyltransferase regulatory subunit HisZ
MLHKIPQETRFRDYLFEEAEFLGWLVDRTTTVFESWGARRIIPSSLTFYEEAFDPSSAFAVYDPAGGKPLALRQDLTEQIRRLLPRMDRYHLPMRLYYVEEVWRVEIGRVDRPGERRVSGVEWIGPPPFPQAEEELFVLMDHLLTPILQPSGLLPITVIFGSVSLYRSWFPVLKSRDPARAFVALKRKDLSLWMETGDPDFPLLPWTVLSPEEQVPSFFPESVAQEIGKLQELAGRLPSSFRVVIDPILPPPSPYYTGIFFAGSSPGLPYEPWLRGGEYRVEFRGQVRSLGFTLDLDPFIEGYRQGVLAGIHARYYLWMDGRIAPPPLPGVRWIPLDPAVKDPWQWASSYGIHGLVFCEDGKMKIYHPLTRACEGELGSCPT